MDERLRTLIARASATDGTPPFSDGALVELARGSRRELWLEDAAALTTGTSAEFVVDPDARRRGQGTRMLEALLRDAASAANASDAAAGEPAGLLVWAHGDHPGARALAARFGLERVRELLHLAGPVPDATANASQQSATVRAFGNSDADAWVALNARAFSEHPEQGAVSRADFDVLRAEPWFDPDDLLLLEADGRLVGSCWLKIDGPVPEEGEFYVVAVDPDHQGEGWGRALIEAGMSRLAHRGIRTAHLYVEGDNAPALALYRSFGFAQRSIDVQYRGS
jgi:mycothiol synthase